MEPDDLLYSRNARPQKEHERAASATPPKSGIEIWTGIVGRAHLRINQATLEKEVGDSEEVRSEGQPLHSRTSV